MRLLNIASGSSGNATYIGTENTHILIDAGKDTLLIVPFLLLTYVAMEWIEHKTSAHAVETIRKAGAAGPAIGAA